MAALSTTCSALSLGRRILPRADRGVDRSVPVSLGSRHRSAGAGPREGEPMRRKRFSRLRLTAIFSALMGMWLLVGVITPASAGNYGGTYLNLSIGKSGGYVNWQDTCPFAEPRVGGRVCSGNNTVSVTDYSDGYRTLFRMYAKGSGTTYYEYVDP